MGSTPHAWGIQPSEAMPFIEYGINPTCVGNTLRKRSYTAILKSQKSRFPLTWLPTQKLLGHLPTNYGALHF